MVQRSTLAKITLRLGVLLLGVVIGGWLGISRVHAMVLNPNPGATIPNNVTWYLATCDNTSINTGGQTPAFTSWISPGGTSAVDLQSSVLTARPGDTITLRYNWAGAVCFDYSNVLQTTARYLASPGVDGLPPGGFLNFTGFYGPGNFNNVGTYRGTYSEFNWVVPDAPIGVPTLLPITINYQLLNWGNNGVNDFFQCVGFGETFRANQLDFGDPNAGGCGAAAQVLYVNLFVPGTQVNSTAANCQAITGNVTTTDDLTAIGYMYTDPINAVEVGRADINPGTSNFSIPVSDQFKDGQSHKYQVRFVKRGTDTQVAVDGGNQTPCPPNALCAADFNANIQAVFPGNVASLNVGESIHVKVTMTNNGESIWGSYASGSYTLQLTPAAAAYWQMSGGSLTGAIVPGGATPSNTFDVTLKLIRAADSASIPLQFQMGYWGGQFGGICATSLRIQAQYGPWLRVQNGNVSALGTITGQPATVRGGYKAEGTGQDINLDAQYAIAAYSASNSFCSANAYNYGHGDAIQCDFGQYKFSLPRQLQYLATPAATDAYFESVKALQASAACVTRPITSSGELFRSAGVVPAMPASVDFGTLNPPPAGLSFCPAFVQLGNSTNSSKSLGALTVTGGRGTIIVHGDLTITGNVVAAWNGTISGREADGTYNEDGLNRVSNLGIIVDGNVTIARGVSRVDAQIYSTKAINTCDAYPSITTGPGVTSAVASVCNRRLVVRGGMFARQGFKFGRNYYDAAHILGRIGLGSILDVNFDYAGVVPPGVQGQYYGAPAEDVIGNGLSLVLPPPGFADVDALSVTEVEYVPGDYAPRF